MALGALELGGLGALGLVVLGLLGVRIAYAAGLVGIVGLVAMLGLDAGIRTAGTVPYGKGTAYTLSVLPMFILLGYLAQCAGVSRAAFEASRRWFGRLPGGLATATVLAVAAFGAVCGSSAAAAAVFSRIAIPEMLKDGYTKSLAGGSVAAGSVLDSIIPPSTLLVVYAIITEQSVADLLVAGFIPGVLTAITYGIIITILAIRNPEIAPRLRRYSWRERAQSVPGVLPIVMIVATIFTAMFYGWATPTEAGALAAFFMLILSLLNRSSLRALRAAFMETAKLTVVVFTIVWSIMIFVLFLGYANLPAFISDWVKNLDVSPTVVLLFVYALFIVLGMFIDALGIMLLTLPIVFPLVVGLGYDPVWFGVIVAKLCAIGLLTPPFGLCCFIVSSAHPEISVQTVFRGVMPFIAADIVLVCVLTAFPEIITTVVHLAR
ncbi:TRAP transporter large permease [Propylenella binzhouense]|uniref:TRAP transporter large permease protein n=1 Tax=Propylenella binzhouense TaxID=2555902 RepID=A0A964WS43_9HYPH|nr:TRAP transporter large permease [Propylenella binzhouense]MYZ46578.1 TRAP transporter large permease [Propylenella binzhouense]